MESKKRLVEKLVEIVEQDKLLEFNNHEIEDKTIEFYELQEFAKKRVLLRKSYKIHLLVYVLVNSFLFYINWVSSDNPTNSIFHFWAYIPVLIWGLFLWIHGVFMVSNNIKFLMGNTLQRKIFIIVSLAMLYLTFTVPLLNIILNDYLQTDTMWWYYIDIFIVVFISVYWYAVKEINEEKLNIKIKEEIGKIRQEYIEHREREEDKIKISKEEP